MLSLGPLSQRRICAPRAASPTHAPDFSLKSATVSTARPGLQSWKSHFAAPPGPVRSPPLCGSLEGPRRVPGARALSDPGQATQRRCEPTRPRAQEAAARQVRVLETLWPHWPHPARRGHSLSCVRISYRTRQTAVTRHTWPACLFPLTLFCHAEY